MATRPCGLAQPAAAGAARSAGARRRRRPGARTGGSAGRLSAAPGCAFVVASTARSVWDGDAIQLAGLELEFALAIVEQEIGRALTPDERARPRRSARARRASVADPRGGGPRARRGALARRGGPLARSDRDARSTDERRGERARRARGSWRRPRRARAPAGAQSRRGRGPGPGEPRAAPSRAHTALATACRSRWRRRSGAAPTSSRSVPGPWSTSPTGPSASGIRWRWPPNGRPCSSFSAGRAGPGGTRTRSASAGRPRTRCRSRPVRGVGRRGRDGARGGPPAGRPLEEAWALHQRGTRTFALDESKAALPDLERARDIRRQIGDQRGETATQHNIEVIRARSRGGTRGSAGAAAGCSS